MNSDQDKPNLDQTKNQRNGQSQIDEEVESKSQRKRNAHQITALAGELVAMKPKALAALPIELSVRDAIKHCAEIRAHGARKRQLHYVSKLLRHLENIEELQMLVENPELKKAKAKTNPHKTFRDDLLDNFSERIDDLRDKYPTVDLQQVRQLVRNAHKESTPVPPETEPTTRLDKTKASKALLRLLIESQ